MSDGLKLTMDWTLYKNILKQIALDSLDEFGYF